MVQLRFECGRTAVDMLYYPQLSSGSVCQFPVARRTQMRVFSNQLLGGDTLRMADSGAQTVQWQLHYAGLTDAEAASIQQLFDTAQGRLDTFVFLDPTDNLLMWSEDWTQAVWTADPMLQVAPGILDPFGTNNAMQLTNTAQANQRIVQATGGPGWFQYCFSVYLRSDAPCAVQLVITSNGDDSLTEISVPSTWAQAVTSAGPSIQGDGVSFGLQLPPGVSLQACAAQAEAQPAAGSYKKTTDRGGVYSTTRFDTDSLVWTTTAEDQNSCQVSLLSRLT